MPAVEISVISSLFGVTDIKSCPFDLRNCSVSALLSRVAQTLVDGKNNSWVPILFPPSDLSLFKSVLHTTSKGNITKSAGVIRSLPWCKLSRALLKLSAARLSSLSSTHSSACTSHACSHCCWACTSLTPCIYHLLLPTGPPSHASSKSNRKRTLKLLLTSLHLPLQSELISPSCLFTTQAELPVCLFHCSAL